MLTHNARRADELVDEVDLQVVDVQALRVIPLVAPVQVGYILHSRCNDEATHTCRRQS